MPRSVIPGLPNEAERARIGAAAERGTAGETVVMAAARSGSCRSVPAALAQAGAILAEAAPSRPGDGDELPNRVIVTESTCAIRPPDAKGLAPDRARR